MPTPYLPPKNVPTTRTLKPFISLFQAFAVIPPSAFVAAHGALDITAHMKRGCLAFGAFYFKGRLLISDDLPSRLKSRFTYGHTTVGARQADTGSHRPMIGFSIPYFTTTALQLVCSSQQGMTVKAARTFAKGFTTVTPEQSLSTVRTVKPVFARATIASAK